MRTTLTLDEDVLAKLRDLAHRRKLPFREVVNSVLRRGLAAQELGTRPAAPFKVQPFRSPFRPGVDPVGLNRLNDELEGGGVGGTPRRARPR